MFILNTNQNQELIKTRESQTKIISMKDNGRMNRMRVLHHQFNSLKIIHQIKEINNNIRLK